MMIWLVNLAGVALIAAIALWFWAYRPRALRAAGGGAIDILVADGVYTPARIEVPAGKPVTLRFLRKDPSACAEKVFFGDLGLSRDLPLDKPQELTFTPKNPGEFEFTCAMGMYRGRLVVRAAQGSSD